MISGEYLVLHGARSLAVPSKFGQKLLIDRYDTGQPLLQWRTFVNEDFWFEAEFSLPEFDVQKTNKIDIANRLSEILIAAAGINPGFIDYEKLYHAESRLDFDLSWGLGSSSSLISNIAYWAGVDPFDLHFKVSQGSAYDIACARAEKAIVYSVHEKQAGFEEVDFRPPFKDHLFFAYSGKKKKSDESVADFLEKKKNKIGSMVHQVNSLTEKMVKARELEDFSMLVKDHERLIAGICGQKPVKQDRFPDFDGEVKSLGAWGGDFLMFCFKGTKIDLIDYLENKSINEVFAFDEILKT